MEELMTQETEEETPGTTLDGSQPTRLSSPSRWAYIRRLYRLNVFFSVAGMASRACKRR